MRIEELIGSYANNQRQAKASLKPLRPLRKGKPLKGGVVDVVCISGDDISKDFEWFAAYVRQLPGDVVSEKIKQIFCKPSSTTGSDDDFLVEKLLFEVF